MNAINTQVKSAAVDLLAVNDQLQCLSFMLGGEVFAMPIRAVKEIIEYGALTEVPRMPNFIRGVINLRGAVVPVIDMGARFGKAPTKISRRTCVVIIEVGSHNGEDDEIKQDIGVMVDAVNEVLEIPASEIEPTPSFGTNIRADFIQGMGKINGKFVIILNVDQVLSLDEIASIASVSDVAVNALN